MKFAFFYGVMLALGLILPLGIQNIFIFNQGATQVSYLRVLPSVITAFICDVILILLAVLGISIMVFTIPWLKNIILSIGILFLSYMGYITWRNSQSQTVTTKPLSIKAQIGFAASVSLLNPHALLDTIGVIGTNSLHFLGYNKFAYTMGCISISFIWFMGLSIAGYYFNKLDKTGRGSVIINKLSALIMWLVALYLLEQLISF